MAKKNSKAENVVEKRPKETPVEFLALLAAVLATGLFIITFVVQAFAIPSISMENTLLIGDHVLVNRIQFAPKSSFARAATTLQQDSSRRHCGVSVPADAGTLRREENYWCSGRPDPFTRWRGLSQRKET
jgi:hypothetical protein